MTKKKIFSSKFIQRFTSVHSWVGICTGMALFIAFFAGTLTMYLDPIQKWANPELRQGHGSKDDLERILRAAADHPDARGTFDVSFAPGGSAPKAVFYAGGPGEGGFVTHTLALDAQGNIAPRNTVSSVQSFINQIHYSVGLPKHAGYLVMGVVSAVYGLALVTGLLIHLPHLLRDLYALRVGKNLKKMWMDAHNVIGVLSLPFHLMFAFTGMLVCLMAILGSTLDAASPSQTASKAFADEEKGGVLMRRHDHGREERGTEIAAGMLPASRLLDIAASQVRGFEPREIRYSGYGTQDARATVVGQVRQALIANATIKVSPVSGEVIEVDAPGMRSVPYVMEGSHVALHFGDFGGQATRAIYFVLGLAGAFLFYSGNLLWIETRRRRHHEEQPMSGWTMAQLSVGICLGCCLGIGLMLLGTQLLPVDLAGRTDWETNLYYVGFFGAVIWSLSRPPILAAVEILFSTAAVYTLLPVLNIARTPWGSPDVVLFDAILLLLAVSFCALGRTSLQRARTGQPHSVWCLTSRPVRSAERRTLAAPPPAARDGSTRPPSPNDAAEDASMNLLYRAGLILGISGLIAFVFTLALPEVPWLAFATKATFSATIISLVSAGLWDAFGAHGQSPPTR